MPPKALHAAGNGSGGNENDFPVVLAQLRDLSCPFIDGGQIKTFAIVGDERRSYFDNESFCFGNTGDGHDYVLDGLFSSAESSGKWSSGSISASGGGGARLSSASCNL